MKALLRAHLAAYNLTAIAELATRRRRTLSHLVALTYDPDPLIAWRAIEAFGAAGAEVAERDPEFVRGHLRRLLWLLSDESGGIGWRAPELIGELLYRCPQQFAEFMPLLVALLDLETEDAARFRAGALWAIGRVAEVAPQPLLAALALIEPFLDDPDPQVRGLAALCLGRLGRSPALAARPALPADTGEVTLYGAGGCTSVTVGRIVRTALSQRASPHGVHEG